MLAENARWVVALLQSRGARPHWRVSLLASLVVYEQREWFDTLRVLISPLRWFERE